MNPPCVCITTPCDCPGSTSTPANLGQVAEAGRLLAWGVAALFLYYAFIKRR